MNRPAFLSWPAVRRLACAAPVAAGLALAAAVAPAGIASAATAGGDAVTAMLTATGEHAAASDSLTGTGVVPSHLYWADVNAGTIVEADLDGTGAQVIASGQGGPAEVAVGQQ